MLAAEPDAVVIATGSRPLVPRHIPGAGLDHVLTPLEALRSVPAGGRNVVIEGGDLIGCQTALWMAGGGDTVTLLAYGRTDLFTDGKEEFGQDMAGTIRRPEVIADLERAVTLRPKWGIKRIHDDGVVIDSAGAFAPHIGALRIGPVDEHELPADVVVIGVKRRPADELYDQLAGSLGELYLVGDASVPRTVEEAVAEGSAAARSLGGDRVDPSMMVPA